MTPEQRTNPRARVDCPVTLVRRRGNPVTGHTQDLGPGGARIIVDRPLTIDEEVGFALDLGTGTPVDGRARVLRQQGLRIYAVRFERLAATASEAITGAITRMA
jgi:hypothetical protein